MEQNNFLYVIKWSYGLSDFFDARSLLRKEICIKELYQAQNLMKQTSED